MAQIDLRALPSLREYANSELKMLASVAPAREYAPGLPLCREGAAGASCFLLAVGSVRIDKQLPDGVKTLATLRTGAIVGQMALVDRSPRSATVVAAEPTVALELTRDVFENLLRASSQLALRFQEQIAIAGIRQLRQATQRLVDALGQEQKAAESVRSMSNGPSERDDMLRYIQAAANEWNVPVGELTAAEGVITQVALWFPQVAESSRTAGLGVEGRNVLVTGSFRGAVRMSTPVVVDQGPGIPENFQARLFGKFEQADRSPTRREEL